MKLEFLWIENNTSDDKCAVESSIKDAMNNHLSFKACHQGASLVELSCPDPLNERLVGNIKCNCGKKIGVIRGLCNGSHLEIQGIA